MVTGASIFFSRKGHLTSIAFYICVVFNTHYSMITTRILWLFCFCMCLSQWLSAQRFQAGALVGLNLSQIDGDRLLGYNQVGLNVGGRVNAVLSDRWQLGVEMTYTQQGAQRAKNDDPASIYDNIRLNFVETPVMLHFKEWKFHLSGGVSYARLINYKVIDVFGVNISDQQTYNPDIFSAVVGLVYYFQDNMGVEGRWFRSLSNIQEQAGAGQFIGRSISIRYVYLF